MKQSLNLRLLFILQTFVNVLSIFVSKTESNNSSIDDDFELSTPAIISKYGYPSESYTYKTIDGFILTMFRIPNANGQPIILQHGLVADSSCFLLKKEDSLPFLLSKAGYDVWLPNFRGTMYSNSHIKYKRENEEYWNWSWDELAAYDLSRTLEIVGKMTNQTGNILYIGYSMGTTTFFALMASKPEYNRYVKAMFALAPVVYVNHMKGPTKLIAFFTRFLFSLRKAMGGSAAVFANIHNYRKLIVNVCSSYLSSVCRIILFLGSGFDVPQLTMKTLYNVYGHLPSSTSIKVTVHYGQQINSGDFGYFDYGEEENKIRYGSKRPPLYNISKITVPIAIYCGKSDWRSQLQDVNRFWMEVPRKLTNYVIPYEKFNHGDFLWAKDVSKLLYNQLLGDIHKFSQHLIY